MNEANRNDHKTIFKAGIIVSDLQKAMTDMGHWLELDWTPIRTAELSLKTAAGVETTELSFVCSTRGNIILELLQANETGYYRPQPGGALHHFGMWVDDLPATSAQLQEQGMTLEAAGVNEDRSPWLFAFHSNPYGLRVELVDSRQRSSFLGWLDGGELNL